MLHVSSPALYQALIKWSSGQRASMSFPGGGTYEVELLFASSKTATLVVPYVASFCILKWKGLFCLVSVISKYSQHYTGVLHRMKHTCPSKSYLFLCTGLSCGIYEQHCTGARFLCMCMQNHSAPKGCWERDYSPGGSIVPLSLPWPHNLSIWGEWARCTALGMMQPASPSMLGQLAAERDGAIAVPLSPLKDFCPQLSIEIAYFVHPWTKGLQLSLAFEWCTQGVCVCGVRGRSIIYTACVCNMLLYVQYALVVFLYNYTM